MLATEPSQLNAFNAYMEDFGILFRASTHLVVVKYKASVPTFTKINYPEIFPHLKHIVFFCTTSWASVGHEWQIYFTKERINNLSTIQNKHLSKNNHAFLRVEIEPLDYTMTICIIQIYPEIQLSYERLSGARTRKLFGKRLRLTQVIAYCK